jgi:hypothetical protein
VLEIIAADQTTDRIEVGTLARAMEHRSVGALLLILALPMVIPIPAPGISAPFGALLMLASTELIFARGKLWLPSGIAVRSISRAHFARFAARVVPGLRRVEHFARPRMTWLTGGWGVRIVGVICLILSGIIALPVPMGNVLPGIVICLLGIGLIESDGLLIAIGLVAAAVVLGIVILASSLFLNLVNAVFNGHLIW